MSSSTNRRDQILQTLAEMLQSGPGVRITTAALARHIGVSEAALYRHFPSKARMFEGLLEFTEDTLFPRIGQIAASDADTMTRVGNIAALVLTFAKRNPGISRLLTGDALVGETERLRARSNRIMDRIETQVRTLLREANVHAEPRPDLSVQALTTLTMSLLEGRLTRFVRSSFSACPIEDWDRSWQTLMVQATAELDSGR